MQEVGGSIPPGSTTLRPSGYAWRSHARPKGEACRAEAHRAKAGLGTGSFSVIASQWVGTKKPHPRGNYSPTAAFSRSRSATSSFFIADSSVTGHAEAARI